MEVSNESLARYWEEYGECGFLEPGDLVFVVAKVNGEEKEFVSPTGETDKSFSDRLLRSKKSKKICLSKNGKNLNITKMRFCNTSWSELWRLMLKSQTTVTSFLMRCRSRLNKL
jgi:hypothetical protein